MKKSFFIVLSVLFAIGELGVFLGFSNGDNPDRRIKTNLANKNKSIPIVTDNNNPVIRDNNNPVSSSGYTVYYSDNFDAPNDTAALKARGYSVYRNGTFDTTFFTLPPNFWYTGNPGAFSGTFPAFNGDPDDYVASDYLSAGDLGDIDNWLVLPSLDVVAGDSICFFSRSISDTTFLDSIRVMYNPTNNTLPSDPNWVELGRFQVAFGIWQLRRFEAPVSGASARFAIRYSVVDGGVFGPGAFYIGMDSLVVKGNGVLPVELLSFASVITNNNVTLNWTTTTETNNSGFDIERSSATGGVNGQWAKVGFVQGNGTTTSPINYSFTDRGLNTGKYNYRLKQIDFNGNFKYFNLSNEVNVGVPTKFDLLQNYPNPFNPSTQINYDLPFDGKVSIKLFDMSGKEVATLVNEVKTAGYYSVNFNAVNLSSGVYFYSITTNNITATKKMMLVK